MAYERMKLLAGTGNLPLAHKIAKNLDTKLIECCGHFPDGEIKVDVPDTVRGADVYILQSTTPPTVDSLYMQLFLMADTVHRCGAHRTTAVLPYASYTRQDRAEPEQRQPLSMATIAKLCKAAELERFIFIDLHNPALPNAFDFATTLFDISPRYLLTNELKKRENITEYTWCPTDLGASKKVDAFTDLLPLPMIQVIKGRDKKGQAYVKCVVGDVKDKRILLCDDMIATGGSIKADTDELRQRGAKSIGVYATHPLLIKNAIDNINNAGIEELITTDTVPIPEEKLKLLKPKIKILSWAQVLAYEIDALHTEKTATNALKKV